MNKWILLAMLILAPGINAIAKSTSIGIPRDCAAAGEFAGRRGMVVDRTETHIHIYFWSLQRGIEVPLSCWPASYEVPTLSAEPSSTMEL